MIRLCLFATVLASSQFDDSYDIERQSVSVECGVDYIEIGVNRTQLLGSYHELSLSMGDFELDGKACLTWETESSHYFRSELGRCGYARQANDSHIIYQHNLEARLITHDVDRVVMYSGKRYVFPVTCTYPRSLRTTLTFGADYDLAANIVELPSVTGIGQFRAAMALYQDGSFLEPFGLNPTLKQDQTMYVGVFLLDSLLPQDNRKLTLRRCWASPSNSSTDSVNFSLISRPGCTNSSMVSIIENGETGQARFASDVFAFVGYSEVKVYLFCDISICFDQCQPECSGRQRRSNKWYNDPVENQIISLGPISIAEGPDDHNWDHRKGYFTFLLRRRQTVPNWFGIPGKYFARSEPQVSQVAT